MTHSELQITLQLSHNVVVTKRDILCVSLATTRRAPGTTMPSMASTPTVGCRVASSTSATGSGQGRRAGSTPRADVQIFRRGALRFANVRRDRPTPSIAAVAGKASARRATRSLNPRAVLDDEGIPWDAEELNLSDLPQAPAGLSYDGDVVPGSSLPELANRLLDAVKMQYKDTMYDECVVDMSPFGVEECSGDLHDACAEVAVSANAAQIAGEFNMAMRRRELRRLRSALWELRKILESAPDGCSITVRHRLELLRSASLDVCHPRMRAADAPAPSAIPNFQTVHLDVEVDAVPDIFSDPVIESASTACDAESGGPAVAFYRGGQPTAEGRSWMVTKKFKTVIDLRFEDRDNQWTRPVGGGAGVGKLGDASLEVIHLPVTDMEPPSFEDVERFIEVADDESKRPMFVHCKAGIGRTGSMVSCWRISHGMKVDDALALESLNCDFGSLAQEAFVREFADRLLRKRAGSWDDDDEMRATIRLEEQHEHEGDVKTKKENQGEFFDTSGAVYKVSGATETPSKSGAQSPTAPDPSKPWKEAAAEFVNQNLETAPAYEGAGFSEDGDLASVSGARFPSNQNSPEGVGSGGSTTDASAVGEHSSLDQAPDMYVIRTDGFTCTREEVEERMLKISHPSTQQLVLVWRVPPRRIFIVKKLGFALLRNLIEVAHAFMSMGFEVIVEESVVEEMKRAAFENDRENVVDVTATEVKEKKRKKVIDPAETASAAEVRDNVLSKVGTLRVDSSDGRIPREDWGTVDLVVCLGGDGVILHASKLFQGPVPPLMGFHFGSMGFLTNHPPKQMAQSLLQSVGRGPKKVANVKGGIPITLRMRLECTLVKKKDSARNGGNGAPSHVYTVLNEVLVDRGPSPFLSKIEAYDRGQLITTIQADGVMLATATGSTAYSVSAGGSMVHPNVPAILMTPICPHTLSFRPVVLPDSVEVELRVADDARCSAWVSFDGKERCELCSGDSIFIRMSQFPVPTINYADQTGDFISSLRRCLRWNERDEQKPLDEAAMRELREIAGDN